MAAAGQNLAADYAALQVAFATAQQALTAYQAKEAAADAATAAALQFRASGKRKRKTLSENEVSLFANEFFYSCFSASLTVS
jgi:hypothetical protein